MPLSLASSLMVFRVLVALLGNRSWLKGLLLVICVSLTFILIKFSFGNNLFPNMKSTISGHYTSLLFLSDDSHENTNFSTTIGVGKTTLKHVGNWTCNTSSNPGRYTIQWFNWEQLTMATNNMIMLAWFVSAWNANVIEPFTLNSRYFGVPRPYKKTIPLFSFLDYDNFNQLLCWHHIPPILRYDEFLRNANRKVILIHILYDGFDMRRFSGKGVSRTELLSLLYSKGGHYAECSSIGYMRRIGRSFLQWINPMTLSHPFTISHYCCVNGSHPTYRGEMARKCGIKANGDVTVVFTDWRGLSPQKNFRVFVPEAKNIDLPHPSRDVYPYSSSVLSNATAFIHSVTNGSGFVGVHWRTEKLGLKGKGYFLQCLDSALKAKSRIMQNLDGNITELHFTDTGPYGSMSCMHHCLSNEFVLSSFSSRGITMTRYNPKEFHGISDSGFVASVEQEALSQARALLLVGGGSFQSQASTRYKHYRNTSQIIIHRLCE